MRTMAQKRAEYALTEILAAKNNVDKEKLKPFSAGAPAMILQNGFGQTLAFWLAKGKPEHVALFDILTRWFKQTDLKNFGECKQAKDYIQKLSTMEQRQYLSAQNEALALLEWVKRFANADLS
ncbi:MAG TPA: type III-B CRISPR module-associated protein Cmr5 [Deltaproteobacteria bacterium]|nr:type III-B CRISPR module-associated protein Cmr5 [Deltaproteobacteria bacterium]